MCYPEVASIFQNISNVDLFESRDIFDLTENSMVFKIADILLQPFFDNGEA